MWTCYSQLNGVVKSKYGLNLKKYARVTSLLKSMDTDIKKKAGVFSKEELDNFIGAEDLGTPYWIVHKVSWILYFIAYCIVLYCTVLYFIVLYCNVLYFIVLYCTVLYSIVVYCSVL